ncbi:MAG: CehA/McbA family metallohydrolase [Bryobacterales bacterium]|nr:CehA/McbA family metallohydrolase [Bryobacterales bacterium]
MHRSLLGLFGLALLTLAIWRIPGASAGQGARSWSRPGQEDLTFWTNHNGLSQIDVEGEVGFGDMARILMRRRANAPQFHAIRDRFVFRTQDFSRINVPDLSSTRFVAGQGRIVNIPSIKDGKGYFHKLRETQPGVVERTIDGRRITLDVRPLARLNVAIVDETGRPASARVYLTGADGLAYAPTGTIARYVSESAEPFFHSPPSFELDLPQGETVVEAARGVEYELARQVINLRGPQQVTLRLKRWVDMPARGWYSGDAHIHANYTAPHHQVITPEDVLTYALAEDLHIPNMMVANSSDAFLHDEALFEGKPHKLSRDRHILYWNEEMRNGGLYGHMCLFGLKKLAEPLFTGFKGTLYEDDYPANYVQAKRAQDQGGAVTYAHPGYAPTFEGASCRELPVDLAMGVIDAMDVFSNNPEEVAMELWYRLLNAGFRLGISAGTDSFTNVADHYVPGGHRVYAHLPGSRLNYAEWLTAYKQGRTFATNGPMLWLKVQGKEPGDELKLPAGNHTLPITVELKSRVPVSAVELVVNGKVLSPAPATVTIDRSAWIAARVKGPWDRLVLNDPEQRAHTSPVYVRVGDTAIANLDDVQFWLDWIDKLIDRTRSRARFSQEQRRQEVLNLFREARKTFEQRRGL